MSRGWSLKRAATTKVIKPHGRKFKYGKEVHKKLMENNIDIHTFYARVNRNGWSIEEACTKKTMTSKEVTDNLKYNNKTKPNWFYKINIAESSRIFRKTS